MTTIKTWNKDRGFGFIEVSGKKIFVHAKAVDFGCAPPSSDLTGRKIIVREIKTGEKGKYVASATGVPQEMENLVGKKFKLYKISSYSYDETTEHTVFLSEELTVDETEDSPDSDQILIARIRINGDSSSVTGLKNLHFEFDNHFYYLLDKKKPAFSISAVMNLKNRGRDWEQGYIYRDGKVTWKNQAGAGEFSPKEILAENVAIATWGEGKFKGRFIESRGNEFWLEIGEEGRGRRKEKIFLTERPEKDCEYPISRYEGICRHCGGELIPTDRGYLGKNHPEYVSYYDNSPENWYQHKEKPGRELIKFLSAGDVVRENGEVKIIPRESAKNAEACVLFIDLPPFKFFNTRYTKGQNEIIAEGKSAKGDAGLWTAQNPVVLLKRGCPFYIGYTDGSSRDACECHEIVWDGDLKSKKVNDIHNQ